MIDLGIEKLISKGSEILRAKRLGLLCNQASVDRFYRHSSELIKKAYPGQLCCLFSPQHGFFAEKQDNMIESDHGCDEDDLPVFSLYGDTRRPDATMFEHFDVLLIDLPDVGTRVYTFMSTMAYCIEEAARLGKTVVVLDRPNPIGGDAIEGNILHENCKSFVGLYPLPMRHGLTLGELALYFNELNSEKCDLHVIPMDGWQRQMHFPECGHPWVYPSPNMPTYLSALVYPGQVIWEGTNISEGRGTTLPFELMGAPFIRHSAILDEISEGIAPGCVLRPVRFEPTSNKWSGEVCFGFQIHVTDQHLYKPYRTSLALLQAIARCYPEFFRLKEPPYEYEYDRDPLEFIIGDTEVLRDILAGRDLIDCENNWQDGLQKFDEQRRAFLLY